MLSLAHTRGFSLLTYYRLKPLQDTSSVSRTCSSFTGICSITSTMVKAAKEEARVSGFAATCMKSERCLESTVMSESA